MKHIQVICLVILTVLVLSPAIYAETTPAPARSPNLDEITRLADDLTAYYKSAFVEQGGGGPFQAFVGQLAAWLSLKNTVNIKEYSRVKHDTAMAFAKRLAGDQNELIGLHYKNKLDSMPDLSFSSDHAGTALAETIFAAYTEGRQAGTVTREETQAVYNRIAERFKTIEPHTAIDMNGNVIAPETNPLSKALFGDRSREYQAHSAAPGLAT